MKLLTKSRFKLGLECPNKLYFTNNEQYANQKSEDPFMQALAHGGFQVEELARLQYPNGIFIDTENYEYEKAVALTNEALEREYVIIYEAAFMVDGYFIRTDILEKRGDIIHLIEVKAKSFDPNKPNEFFGEKGGIEKKWKPYLFDLAFQKKVAQMAFPNFDFKAFLLLADKSKSASIDGLNQMFRIPKGFKKRTDIKRLINSMNEVGNSVLTVVDMDSAVNDILADKHLYHKKTDLGFEKAMQTFRDAYQNHEYYNWPTKFSICKKCEFRCTDEDKDKGKKSGFEYCFKTQLKWNDDDFKKPNAFEIWDYRSENLLQNNLMFLEQINQDDIKYNDEAGKISRTERQWIQIEKSRSNDDSIYVLKEELKEEMAQWKFPLHFIDFETSTVALPFTKGRKPYEQVAFQFSHHIYYENGKIEHKDQFIDGVPGEFPNFKFIRALKQALSEDDGTIFRFATHENSILNSISKQLMESIENDKEELISFIRTITKSTKNSTEQWEGERNMVDLNEIVKLYYYNPATKGSNSIKAVLPAILKSSEFLRNKYSKTIGEIGLSSLNFKESHIWLDLENEKPDPYKSLPKLFEEWSEEDLEKTLSEMDGIADGGAALTAYSKLQFTDMEDREREELIDKLLRYCELDTLAMVMLYEHFVEIIFDGDLVVLKLVL